MSKKEAKDIPEVPEVKAKVEEKVEEKVEDIKEEINPEIMVSGIVPTFYDQRTKISRDILERLQSDERYKDLLFKTPIRANTTIAASSDKGKPVVFYRKSSFGASDYISLAREFMGS